MNHKARLLAGCEGVRFAVFRLNVLQALFVLLAYSGVCAEPDPKGSRNSEGVGNLPSHRVSVKPLDLSRPPTTEELMAAGQLGGVLFPTHELSDKHREESARLDFGKAIEEWNKH